MPSTCPDAPPGIRLRPAAAADLEALNAVVERAVMTWGLPERVKRLSLPSYRYAPQDLEVMDLVVALDAAERIVGIAAWTEAAADAQPGRRPLLLHGLYVDPARARRGIGALLLRQAALAAARAERPGLLVKAQADARGFFQAMGLRPLPVADADRDYPHRFWLPAAAAGGLS